MPYAKDYIGIYKIVNSATGGCYVGQSQNVRKRVAEHFRLLRADAHCNRKLQHSFNKHGEQNFKWSLEVVCAEVKDLDVIEEAFLSGRARFTEPACYNLADFSKAPMRGRTHSLEAKQRISKFRNSRASLYTGERYKAALKQGHLRRWLANPEFVAKLKVILDNSSMSYAARGRVIGSDASSVRKLALKYSYLKGVI